MLLNLFFWGTVLLLVIVAYVIGKFLPVKHYVSSILIIPTPAEEVWNKLIRFWDYPNWRLNLKGLEVISENEWIETDHNYDQVFFEMTILEDYKLKAEIRENSLPYSGSWVIGVHSIGRYTIVRIIEEGEIYNPFVRTFSKYIIGYSTPIEQYLKFLELSFTRKERKFWLFEKSLHYIDSIYAGLLLQPYIKDNQDNSFGQTASVA
jgi:hypothetical protein